MQIPTNKMGLLLAEVDSSGSLRLSGDRVLFGAKRNQSETEWLVRQKVAQYRQSIADIVHSFGGVVAYTQGDRVLCNLADAPRAMRAACAIQQSIARKDGPTGSPSALVTTQMGIRIALHYDRLLVDGGRLAGPALTLVQALLQTVDTDQILATAIALEHIETEQRPATKALAPMRLIADEETVKVVEVDWRAAPDVQTEQSITNGTKPEAPGMGEQISATPTVGDASAALPLATVATNTSEIAPNGPAAEAPTKELVAATRMELRYRGKQIVLDGLHPTITLRGGPERIPHARITLSDNGFVLQNLNTAGTLLRDEANDEIRCTEEANLEGSGAISLSQNFEAESQIIEYSVHT